MRLFFKIIGLVFFLFIGLMIGGFFMSPVLTVERQLYVGASADDVFPYLEDLELSSQWSPFIASRPDMRLVYGAAVDGVGASVMWQSSSAADAPISSQEIISSQPPEFVQAALLLDGEPASVTYALLPSETDNANDSAGARTEVGVFITFEKDIGGFPYLQRLTKGTAEKAIGRDFDAALARLKTIVES